MAIPIKGIPIEQLDGIQQQMVRFNNMIEPYYQPRISVDERTYFLIDIPCHPTFKDEPLFLKEAESNLLDLSGHLKDIYIVIKDNPQITIKQMAELLSFKDRRVRYLLEILKVKGYIERQGKKGGHWIVLR